MRFWTGRMTRTVSMRASAALCALLVLGVAGETRAASGDDAALRVRRSRAEVEALMAATTRDLARAPAAAKETAAEREKAAALEKEAAAASAEAAKVEGTLAALEASAKAAEDAAKAERDKASALPAYKRAAFEKLRNGAAGDVKSAVVEAAVADAAFVATTVRELAADTQPRIAALLPKAEDTVAPFPVERARAAARSSRIAPRRGAKPSAMARLDALAEAVSAAAACLRIDAPAPLAVAYGRTVAPARRLIESWLRMRADLTRVSSAHAAKVRERSSARLGALRSLLGSARLARRVQRFSDAKARIGAARIAAKDVLEALLPTPAIEGVDAPAAKAAKALLRRAGKKIGETCAAVDER